MADPRDPDEDPFANPSNFGERPELPTFDEEELEAAIWRMRNNLDTSL